MFESLRKEFEYYLSHQAEFVEKYNGKVIALKEFEVLGAFNSEWEAVQKITKEHPLGSFIVQRVSPGTEAYTVQIASNLVYSGA